MAPVIAPSTWTTWACSRVTLVSGFSACDADTTPSRSSVPGGDRGAARRDSPSRPPRGGWYPVRAVGPGRPSPAGRLWRPRPSRGSPGGPGPGGRAGLVDAVGQVEAGRAFGDQRPVPRPLTARHLAAGGVEATRRPGIPAAHARSASSSRTRCKKLSGASAARAASHPSALQFRQRPARCHAVPGPPRPREAAEQTSQSSSGRCPRPTAAASRPPRAQTARPRSPKMAAATAPVTCAWSGPRIAPLDGSRLRRGGAFAAERVDQPPVAVEPLANPLVAGTAGKGQPGLHLGDEAIQ